MSGVLVWKRQAKLAQCAPFSDARLPDRAMRTAVFRARKQRRTAEAFARQQAFDAAIAKVVREIAVPPETAEWFVNEKLVVTGKRRGWKRTVRHPAVVAIALAVAVIIGIGVHIFMDQIEDFPGSAEAKRMLTEAASTRISQLEPVHADAGEMGDLFFMKYRLEHYNVPPEFAKFRVLGWRVFIDDNGRQVAQIEVEERRMQFFIFPVEKPAEGKPAHFDGWRYIEQDNWVGAIKQGNGVNFLACLRGRKRDLAAYIKQGAAEAAAASGR